MGQRGEVAGVVRQFVILLLVVVGGSVGLSLFVGHTSLTTSGVIVAKEESVDIGRGDSWNRSFRASYRYQPNDERSPRVASQSVDFDTYQRLRIGAPATIHYSPYSLARLIEGLGSYIDGSPSRARLMYQAFTLDDWLFFVGFSIGALLGWAAYRLKSGALAIAAVMFGGIGYPVFVLMVESLLIVPLVFWMWWKRNSRAAGPLLLASVVGTIAIVIWRVPHPEPLPSGATTQTTAVVRKLKTVTRIWSSGPRNGTPSRNTGFNINTPFYLLDLELTPAGGTEPVHAVDKIDMSSRPALRQGDTVAVFYPIADPRAARIAEATREFDTPIIREMLGSAFAVAVLFTLSVPVLTKISGFFDNLTRVVPRYVPPEGVARAEQEVAALPAGDPRRQRFEAYMRAVRERDESKR